MFDSGTLYICNLVDTAEPGDMPKMKLQIVSKYWYEDRVVGFNRQYAANGVNQRVDKLVRIALDNSIQIGQYAVLGNGEQFRIDHCSPVQDVNERTKIVNSKYYRQPRIIGLKMTELTLSRLESNYDVATD